MLLEAGFGYEDVLNPQATTPHMGIDESGKGDYFGPLVTASAYVDQNLAKAMEKMGVRDSKKLTDKQSLAIGAKLRALLGRNRYAIVAIGPETYNRLYAKIKNVNRLLSWAHARVIENLLDTMPSCPRAVADQFGAQHLIERALMQKGRSIELEQHHKAESDIAVAAASILAREGFLYALQRLGQPHGITLPKGASDQVRQSAIELVRKEGPGILLKVAKCHFRTTDALLSAAGATRAALGPEGAASPERKFGGKSSAKADATPPAKSPTKKGTKAASPTAAPKGSGRRAAGAKAKAATK